MSALLVIPNSSAACTVAGAIIVEDIGLTNVNAETMIVATHFLRYDQLEYNQCRQLNKKRLHDLLFRIHWVIRSIPSQP